jgi:hypothetical protein
MREYWNRWVNILVVVASTSTTTSNLLLGSCRPNFDECELKKREKGNPGRFSLAWIQSLAFSNVLIYFTQSPPIDALV